MKKGNNTYQKWIGMLFYMLMGAMSGIFIMRYIFQFDIKTWPFHQYMLLFLSLVLSLYIAIVIQIIIHESGHLLFGLLSGYRFLSFRIFNWMWIKVNGKLQFKHLHLAGTGGQCLMSPPDVKDGKIPVLLYNFGGVIMNVIASAFFFCLSFLFAPTSFICVFLQILTVVGIGFAIINGVPMHFGPVDNDGCNALSLIRNEKAMRAFWIQLKVNEKTAEGMRLKDMPEEWFTVPDAEDMKDGLIALVGALACNRLMDEHRFTEADTLMNRLLSMENKIVELHRSLMICDRICIELMGSKRREVLDSMMTKEQKLMMNSMKEFPSVLRTEYAMALQADHDIAKANDFEKKFEHVAVRYPYPSEIITEKELMEIIKHA